MTTPTAIPVRSAGPSLREALDGLDPRVSLEEFAAVGRGHDPVAVEPSHPASAEQFAAAGFPRDGIDLMLANLHAGEPLRNLERTLHRIAQDSPDMPAADALGLLLWVATTETPPLFLDDEFLAAHPRAWRYLAAGFTMEEIDAGAVPAEDEVRLLIALTGNDTLVRYNPPTP